MTFTQVKSAAKRALKYRFPVFKACLVYAAGGAVAGRGPQHVSQPWAALRDPHHPGRGHRSRGRPWVTLQGTRSPGVSPPRRDGVGGLGRGPRKDGPARWRGRRMFTLTPHAQHRRPISGRGGQTGFLTASTKRVRLGPRAGDAASSTGPRQACAPRTVDDPTVRCGQPRAKAEGPFPGHGPEACGSHRPRGSVPREPQRPGPARRRAAPQNPGQRTSPDQGQARGSDGTAAAVGVRPALASLLARPVRARPAPPPTVHAEAARCCPRPWAASGSRAVPR